MAERVGFEPTEGYKPSPVFKTGALSQLDHLSGCFKRPEVTDMPDYSTHYSVDCQRTPAEGSSPNSVKSEQENGP